MFLYMPQSIWTYEIGPLHIYASRHIWHICISYICNLFRHIQYVIYVVCFHFHTWKYAHLLEFQKNKIWKSMNNYILFLTRNLQDKKNSAVFPSEPHLCQFAVYGNFQLAPCCLQEVLHCRFYKKDIRHHMNSTQHKKLQS